MNPLDRVSDLRVEFLDFRCGRRERDLAACQDGVQDTGERVEVRPRRTRQFQVLVLQVQRRYKLATGSSGLRNGSSSITLRSLSRIG